MKSEKITVICVRCGWRGKRSTTTIWPACPRCGANADFIWPLQEALDSATKIMDKAFLSRLQ